MARAATFRRSGGAIAAPAFVGGLSRMRIRILHSIVAALTVAAFSAACCESRDESDENDEEAPVLREIDAALDRIDTEEFFTRTMGASGHSTVRSVVLGTDEWKLLNEHAAGSVPRVIERIRREGAVRRQETLVVYFLLLGRVGGPDARSALLDWIDQLPDSDREAIHSPWHPWYYAFEALGALGALSGLAEGADRPEEATAAFDRRREIVEELRR